MKKKLLVIGLFSISSAMMFSCKDDDPIPSGNELPTEFSSKSPEENKAQLESNGIQLVNDLEALKQSTGIEAIANFISLINSSGSENMRKSSSGILLRSLQSLRSGKGSTNDVFSAMRLSEEPGSLKEVFEENSGTYNWDSEIEDFDFVSGGSQIIFKFPSAENGTSNNAILTLKDYQGVQVTSPVDDYAGDLPTKLIIELTVDGSKVMDYAFNAAYNNSGEPTSLNTKLTISPFALSIILSNTTQLASFDYSFTKDSQVLISFGATAKGNFNTNNLENGEGSDILTEATAHFQLLNIKISGVIDYAAMEKELEGSPASKEDEIVNKHLNLIVYYANSNQLIADTEYYTYTETDSYTYWADMNGDEIEEEYTEYYEDSYADLRLIFADGSKSDFNTYFNQGFNELKEKIDALIEG